MKRNAHTAPLFKLRVELLHVTPVIWRTIIVPGSMTLGKLHRVLQAVMGWQDYHLHEYLIDVRRYGVLDPTERGLWNEAHVELGKALGSITSFKYDYDFGDDWEHRITVEGILPPDPTFQWPRCTDGKYACPPEDVGGPLGFADFLVAMRDPAHESHKTVMTWYGRRFNAGAFDLIGINQRLVEVMLRRKLS